MIDNVSYASGHTVVPWREKKKPQKRTVIVEELLWLTDRHGVGPSIS